MKKKLNSNDKFCNEVLNKNIELLQEDINKLRKKKEKLSEIAMLENGLRLLNKKGNIARIKYEIDSVLAFVYRAEKQVSVEFEMPVTEDVNESGFDNGRYNRRLKAALRTIVKEQLDGCKRELEKL